MKSDAETTIKELKDLIVAFRDERGWQVHHKPKNLAMSIAIEAAELMEHFQWDDFSDNDKQEIAAELADVLAYCFNLADTLDIDIATAFRDKLKKSEKKFPVELFNPSRQSPEDYKRIKQAYRQKKAKP